MGTLEGFFFHFIYFDAKPNSAICIFNGENSFHFKILVYHIQ